MAKILSLVLPLGAAFTFFSGALASRKYFNNPETQSDYRLTSAAPVVAKDIFPALDDGACGVNTAVNTTALAFDDIFSWHEGYTKLARGDGDQANETLEDCLRLLITHGSNDARPRNDNVAVYIIFFGVIGLIFCVSASHILFRHCYVHGASEESLNTDDIEINAYSDRAQASRQQAMMPSSVPASMSVDEGQGNAIQKRKQRRSFSERLEALGFDGEVPHEFCCPISQSIMDCPVLFSDGHNYDEHSIQRLLEKAGPLRSPITNLPATRHYLVNYDLNSRIDEFVIAMEQQYAETGAKSMSLQ